MKRSSIVGIVVVVIVVVIAGVYLGTQKSGSNNNNGGGGNTPSNDNPVSIANFAFVPNIITVHVGDNVTWTNNDGSSHHVVNDGNSSAVFDSGVMGQGATYVHQFNQVGDFWYHCSIHSSMTHAIVRVVPVITG
jgi:plastocyanin